ncbi:MAG: Rieske 2Fe-2S domain-containing protein [Variovorax sp.]|nr:Rieske 2Fe-2S domain-containing protein [Variovorax sp.]
MRTSSEQTAPEMARLEGARPPARARASVPIPIRPQGSHARSAVGEKREPMPNPNGWVAACYSHELKRGSVLTIPFMEQELVLYRTASGIARAIDPYCPHMGAHLGNGGKVVGEDLVCPFHGLAYGPDGACVRTGNGEKPPRAALTLRHVHEINNAILVWVHHDNLPPQWEFPAFDLADRSRPGYSTHHLTGYFLDPGENSADVVHFGWLHGFKNPRMTAKTDGHQLEISFAASWRGLAFNGHFLHYGVACSYAELAMPKFGLVVAVPVFCTPVAPFQWTLRWFDVMRIDALDRWPSLPRRLVYALLGPFTHRWVRHVMVADFPIWAQRKYLKHPKLTASERPLAIYRRWAAQFYPSGTGPDTEAADEPFGHDNAPPAHATERLAGE